MSPRQRQQLEGLAQRVRSRWSVRGGRLVAVVISLPPASSEALAAELRRAMQKLGLSGVELVFAMLPGPPRLVALEFER